MKEKSATAPICCGSGLDGRRAGVRNSGEEELAREDQLDLSKEGTEMKKPPLLPGHLLQ